MINKAFVLGSGKIEKLKKEIEPIAHIPKDIAINSTIKIVVEEGIKPPLSKKYKIHAN